MLVILKYWQPIASAAIALVFAYLLHTVVLNSRLASQEADLRAACRKAQTLSYEVSNEYQANLANLANRLSGLSRVPRCIPVSNAPSGRDGAPEGQGYAGAHGVDSKDLYDFAFDAERYRLQLVACQSFIRKAIDE